jgi:8-oxo-dGTP pyrophosphatase MutT (NUDIX family)
MDTGIGIKGLVIKGEDILILRKPNGDLDLPGGRVERGESPAESLEREIYEELGRVRVRILSPVAAWSFVKNSGLLVKGQSWACSYLGGRICLSVEHVGFIWIRGYQLRTLNLSPRFGLTEIGTWANSGVPKVAGSISLGRFQQFHLKGVENFVHTDWSGQLH